MKFKQSHYIMDYTIQRRMPLRWVLTSSVSVLSWECSPLALKNKPAVPVGYHTPCRSSYRELNVSSIFPQYVRATTNTVFNKQMRLRTVYLKHKKMANSLMFRKGQEPAVVCLTLSRLGVKKRKEVCSP